MTYEELKREITTMIARVIEMPVDEINPDADFVNELDVDSLKAIEITGAIEKRFRVVVPEEQIRNIRTVNQAISLAAQLLNIK